MATIRSLFSLSLFFVTAFGNSDNGEISSDIFFGDELNCFNPLSCALLRSFSNDTHYENIECYGYYSCIFSVFEASEDIECKGPYSCVRARLSSYEVYCEGLNACDNVIIEANREIECSGANACGQPSYMKSDTVWCQGSESCVEAEEGSIEANTLYCSGHDSCEDSIFSDIARIVGSGNGALNSATIIASESNSVDIYAYGYQAGKNMILQCESGSKCHVYCTDAASCGSISDNCDSGATCNVETVSTAMMKDLIAKQNLVDGVEYGQDSNKLERRESRDARRERIEADIKSFKAHKSNMFNSDNIGGKSVKHGTNDFFKFSERNLLLVFASFVVLLSMFGIVFCVFNCKEIESNKYQLIS